MKTIILLFTTISIFYSCSNCKEDNTLASHNKMRIMEFYDQVVNAHNADLIDSFFTEDFSDPQMNPEQPQIGAAGIKASFKNDFFTAFPDGHVDVHFLVASGDTVVAQVTLSGTNTGTTAKMQATNKKVKIDGTAIFVLRNGKIAKRMRFFDDLLMMQQLGMVAQRKDSV